MSIRDTQPKSLNRRALLFGLPAFALHAQQQAAGKGQPFASDMRRYADAATEFQVLRFTSPTYTSVLPAYYNRCMSGRNTLYFACDRSGKMEVFRGDVKGGQTRQLTACESLDPQTIALAGSGDRSLCFFDGTSLRQLTLSSLREREVYRLPSGATRGRGFSLSADGNRAFFVEQTGGKNRLIAVTLLKGQAATLFESAEEISDPIARPGASGGILHRRGETWWLNDSKLALAPGEALSPWWSPDGNSLLYINVSPERGQLNTIRELSIGAGGNQVIAKTSQFIAFGPNGDASVFVGASGSKASPHILILIRSVKRELTLCEHRASNPRMASPMFAPNSQRILFGSDQHGKPAIYTMNVERFVEETES